MRLVNGAAVDAMLESLQSVFSGEGYMFRHGRRCGSDRFKWNVFRETLCVSVLKGSWCGRRGKRDRSRILRIR